METVGFIGLGAMGGPVAGHIQRAGYPLVVHDVRDEATRSFGERGATVVDSAAALARTSDVIITALPMPEDVEQVACGRDGIIEGIKPGSVYGHFNQPAVANSPARATVSREGRIGSRRSGRLRPTWAARGIHEVMVGGAKSLSGLNRYYAFGDQVLYAGPLGSGSICKLVHQMIGCAVSQALAEGLSLGSQGRVEPKTLWDCVRRGMVGRMHVLHYQVPQTVFRGTFETDTFPSNCCARMWGWQPTSAGINVPLALANIAEQSLVEAINRGWGDKAAYTVTFLLQEEAAQVRIRATGVDPNNRSEIHLHPSKRRVILVKRREPCLKTDSKCWIATCTFWSRPTFGSDLSIPSSKTTRPGAQPIMSGICDWWDRMGGRGAGRWTPPETIPPPGHIFHRNQKLFRPHMERGWSSQVQLDAMDEEGIDLAVLYPSRGLNVLSIPAMDPSSPPP